MNTDELITELAKKAAPVKPLPKAAFLTRYSLLALFIYLAVICAVSGLRADLGARITDPFFVTELALLLFISGACAASAIRARYPDFAGGNFFMNSALPRLIAFLIFAAIQAELFFYPPITNFPTENHGLLCALSVSLIGSFPGAALFLAIKKGAGVIPAQAGAYAVLSGATAGCLALRLTEISDDPFHLIGFHYFPTLLLTLTGAYLGGKLLKW